MGEEEFVSFDSSSDRFLICQDKHSFLTLLPDSILVVQRFMYCLMTWQWKIPDQEQQQRCRCVIALFLGWIWAQPRSGAPCFIFHGPCGCSFVTLLPFIFSSPVLLFHIKVFYLEMRWFLFKGIIFFKNKIYL